MRQLIESRLTGLKALAFSELEKLPKYQDEKVDAGGKRVTLAIWKDQIDQEHMRIVVQAHRYWCLGIGRMDAVGFAIDRAGNLRDLARSEIYDFV